MDDAVGISFESKCICYVSCIHKDTLLQISRRAPCSGFFWRHETKTFLVTNRHCVTGKDSKNRLFSEKAFEPTHLQIHFHERGEAVKEGVTSYRWKAIEASLYQSGEPTWIEHPLGRNVDLVAVALDDPASLSVDCINDRPVYEAWRPEVGADCFIVGYPEGLAGAQATPIWKRASIATEPEMLYKDRPIFLCDSATRPGLSGAPVFAKALGFFSQEYSRIDPFAKAVQFLGSWPVFLGVYAGREGDEVDGFQLARVWKRSVLDDLFKDPRPAESPFVLHR